MNRKGVRLRTCKVLTVVATLLVPMFFASCEVDFSPNAEWKEVPVLYCVIDQDDDTTWARVEKCYLGNESIYSYGRISDSINYAPGSISVWLVAIGNGQVKDSIGMQYTEVDHFDGAFASQAQPVYYGLTKDRLHEDCEYILRVRKTADNSVIAESKPVNLVIQKTEQVVARPANTGVFGFYESRGPATAFCRIEWPAMENARLYEPIVRFYYAIDTDTMYLDIKCGEVKGNSTSQSFSMYYSRSVFLNELKNRLQDDPRQKKYIRKVDIFVTACSEELNAYLATVGLSSNIDQGREVYSNIDGGVGVVASRRTHLYKTVDADSSMRTEMGLYYYILNLDINMI